VMLECPALGRLLAPEEVSAALLRELADRSRRHLDADLTGAVRGSVFHPSMHDCTGRYRLIYISRCYGSILRSLQSVVVHAGDSKSASVPVRPLLLMPAWR